MTTDGGGVGQTDGLDLTPENAHFCPDSADNPPKMRNFALRNAPHFAPIFRINHPLTLPL